MEPRIPGDSFAIFILAGLLFASAAIAQDAAPTFAVSVSKSEVVVGEPLVMAFEVSNRTEQEILCNLYSAEAFARRDFWLEEVATGRRVWGQTGRDGVVGSNYVLGPGESLRFQRLALLRENVRDLRSGLLASGSYEFVACYLWGTTILKSVPIKVGIKEPPTDEQSHLRVINEVPAGFWAGKNFGRVSISQFSSIPPASVYAPYIAYASLLQDSTAMLVGGEVASRPQDEALELDRIHAKSVEFLERWPGWPLNDHVRLIRHQAQNRNRRTHSEAVAQLIATIPANTEAGAIARRLNETPVRLPSRVAASQSHN